jgi:hypothetical protein
MGDLSFSARALFALRAFVLSSLAVLPLVFSTTSFAINSTTYLCSEEQRSMIESSRGGAGASCIAKPYSLVCTDDGRYGCCKSACECIFKGRVFLNKGWGGGARNLTTYDITDTCPVVPVLKDPTLAAPGVADRMAPPKTTPPAPVPRKP